MGAILLGPTMRFLLHTVHDHGNQAITAQQRRCLHGGWNTWKHTIIEAILLHIYYTPQSSCTFGLILPSVRLIYNHES